MNHPSQARERLTVLRECELYGLAARNVDLDAQLAKVDFGGVHREVRVPIFDQYPVSLQVRLKERYLETSGLTRRVLFGDARWRALEEGRGTDSCFQADMDLEATDRILRASFVNVAFDDEELRERAVRHARACGRIAAKYPAVQALQFAGDYARRRGVAPAMPREHGATVRGCIKRLKTKRWWCRAMRRAYGRQAESALRRLGFVHNRVSLYVSAEALQSRIRRRLALSQLLDDVTATNDQGQSFSLSELSACNTSNPVVRRAELMVRVRGVETYANDHGHAAQFYVVTAPSRFHCRDKHGEKNPRFAEAGARDAHRWLNRQWQCLRASLNRKGIVFYGVRTTEPHHDGTPHWNVLIFALPSDAEAIAEEFEKYFLLSDSPDEPGARLHRVRRIAIDPERGDATSYIAKYISKGIDGFGVGVDREDSERLRDAAETCVRVEAWASVHGIRQFQFFGGPPVTVWRELRRLHRPSMGVIEQARLASEEPSWSSYISVQGGTQRLTSTRPVRLHKANSAAAGLYEESTVAKIVGVESDDLVEVTRNREWAFTWPDDFRRAASLSSSESCQ